MAPKDEFGAIGCVSVAQSVGNVFYIATAASIFQNVGVKDVTSLVPANMADDVRPLLAGASGALFKALSESQGIAVTAAIVQSLDKVYLMLVSASAVCLILAPFLGVSRLPSLAVDTVRLLTYGLDGKGRLKEVAEIFSAWILRFINGLGSVQIDKLGLNNEKGTLCVRFP